MFHKGLIKQTNLEPNSDSPSEERHVIDDDENDKQPPTDDNNLWVPERNEENTKYMRTSPETMCLDQWNIYIYMYIYIYIYKGSLLIRTTLSTINSSSAIHC